MAFLLCLWDFAHAQSDLSAPFTLSLIINSYSSYKLSYTHLCTELGVCPLCFHNTCAFPLWHLLNVHSQWYLLHNSLKK
jgi:hypothetical protein